MLASRSAKGFLLLVLLAGIGVCFLFLRRLPAAEDHRILFYGLRAGIVALSLTGWFVSQSLLGSRGLKAGGIADGMHELTAPLHRYLLARPACANGVLIASSAFIDLFGLFLIGASLFGPTMRPLVAMLTLFIMRQVCQALCALPAPPDMIWRHPGFPSLLVTYGVANDFFFSGHTAIAVLGALEIARLGPAWLGAAAGVVAAGEAAVVLTLRAHYTMDIFGAVVAALCALNFADWLCAVF